MASWGIELELPGASLEVHIHRVDVELVELGRWGQVNARRFPLDIDPIHIVGPTRLKEFKSLQSLANKIACSLDEEHVPRNISLQGHVNFTQEVMDFIDAQSPEMFVLYKCAGELLDPPFDQAINIHENIIRGHFIFSADHFKGFVIPEIITNPFGLRPGGFNEAQLNKRDAIAFLQSAYRYAIAICQHLSLNRPLTRNVQMDLPTLSKIGQLFNIIPDSLRVIASGTMHLKHIPTQPLRIASQLNTIIDLTHFSNRPQAGIPDPLEALLRLSNTLVKIWLPRKFGPDRLIDYELAILNFTRNMIDNMNRRVGLRAPHVSDPWIRGAIGLGVWSVVSLCIGGRTPYSAKNLWLLMPKINAIDFLTGAFEANRSLPPPANNYYIELIMNFVPAFQEVYGLLPQDGALAMALNNNVTYEGRNLIEYRLMTWCKDFLSPKCPNLDPNDVKTIRRLIMAALICGVPRKIWPDIANINVITILRGTFDSDNDLLNSCSFVREILSLCGRLSIKDRGGYGRPKFELRSLSFVNVEPSPALPIEPNYNVYINIFNAVARPAVDIPLPPDVPAEYQQVFPPTSVDSRGSGSLYGGSLDVAQRQESHYVWFPGIPGSEHGRRASARVRRWLDEQKRKVTKAS